MTAQPPPHQCDLNFDPHALMPRAFPPHPRVLCTPADLHRTRELIAQNTWHADALQQLITELAEAPPIPDALGDTPDLEQNSKLLAHARAAALVSLLTDAPQHRDTARRAMRVLTRHYINWPIIEGCRALPPNNLSEARFMLGLAEVIDLLAADPLDDSDLALFQSTLDAAIPACDAAPHASCGNHNTWQIVARLAVGIARANPQDIHDALYGCPWTGHNPWRHGLIHQLQHDFLADGFHWERAPGYHYYTLMAVTESAILLQNVGVDLWHADLPAQLDPYEVDLHRAYGPEGTRNLKAAFDAPLYQTFPNGDFSLLHDSGLAHLRGTHIWGMLYQAAYQAYNDPRYAWLINLNEQHIPPDQRRHPALPNFCQDRAHLFVRTHQTDWPAGAPPLDDPDRQISQTGAHQRGCTLFPATGLAILRAHAADDRAPSVSLNFGPHSAGHQSPAMLHVDLHANHHRRTDAARSEGYGDPTHLTWNRTTIAHNTVTLDHQSQFPYDFETDSIWEADLWRDHPSDSTLDFFQTEDQFKAVRAHNDAVYPDARLDRTIILTTQFIIDVFRVISADARTCDWAVHGVGRVDPPNTAQPINLGAQRGYRHFINPQRWPVSDPRIDLTWRLTTGQSTRAQIILPTRAQLITATDPACPHPHLFGVDPDEDSRRTTAIVRAKSDRVVFISLWQFDAETPADFTADPPHADADIVLHARINDDTRTWRLPYPPDPVTCDP